MEAIHWSSRKNYMLRLLESAGDDDELVEIMYDSSVKANVAVSR